MQLLSTCICKTATSAGTNAALVSGGATSLSRRFPTVLSQLPSKNGASKIHNKRWKKDVIYLYQFNRALSSPNISPFCFKVETWLRANKLKHELRSNWTFQPWERYYPFVELNGKKISDSQLILEQLQEYFNLNDELKGIDIAVSRGIDRMVERNTHYLLLYFIFVENLPKFLRRLELSLIKRWYIRGTIFPFHNKVRRLLEDVGLNNISRNDLINMLQKDIAAIDVILGDKKFLFGVEPTTSDFTVFGHLATSYYLPFHQPITDILDGKYPRVKRLIERMRQHYYPEWEFNT